GRAVVARVDVLERPRGPGAAVGAACAVHDQMQGGELAVLRGPRLDPLHGGRAVARCQMLLLAIEEELDGSARFLRELRGGDALDAGAELGAEASAHVLGDDGD